mmetsp:Transcript_15889/g.37176  ORF Transcript_15889/g.37176 Transcript_15889/m.37176 type:complete len:230 (+) Transcript_15889:201-890(+)
MDVRPLGQTLGTHDAHHKLVDANATVAVQVHQSEDFPRMRDIKLQCGKERADLCPFRDLFEVLPTEDASLVLVKLVEELLQAFHHFHVLLELSLGQGLAVSDRSVRSRLNEDADNYVEHSNHQHQYVEQEEAHVERRHLHERLCNSPPVDPPRDGHEEREGGHGEGVTEIPQPLVVLAGLRDPLQLQILKVADHALRENQGEHQDGEAQKGERPQHWPQGAHNLQEHDP